MDFIRYICFIACIFAAYTYYGVPLAIILIVTFIFYEFLYLLLIYQIKEVKDLSTKMEELKNPYPDNSQVLESSHQFSAAPLSEKEENLFKELKAGNEEAANEFLYNRNIGNDDEFDAMPMHLKKTIAEQIYLNCPKDSGDDWASTLDDTK